MINVISGGDGSKSDLPQMGLQLRHAARAGRARLQEVVHDCAQEARHRGPLVEQRRVDGGYQLVEMVIEPQYAKVLHVGGRVFVLLRCRVSHGADADALALLARPDKRRDEVAIARDEYGHVKRVGHRRVVKHVDGQRDVDALLLATSEVA